MLVITRRVGETVYVGDEITVTVVGVQGAQVRLGLNAPREVQIDREEVRARKRREALSEAALHPQSTVVSSATRPSSTCSNE